MSQRNWKKYSVANKDAEEILEDFLAAAKEGQPQILQLIHRDGKIDVNGVPERCKSQQGLSALHLAVRHNQPPCVEWLLNNGANVDICDNFGFRPVHDAALYGYVDCLDLLVGAGSSVGGVEQKGLEHVTPLFYAAQQNHISCIKALKRRTESTDFLLWDISSKRGNPSVIALTSSEKVPDDRLEALLNNSAQTGNTKYLKLVKDGIRRELDPKEAHLAMCTSAAHGKLDFLRDLLESGISPDAGNAEQGVAPIHYAARYGQVDCIELLVKYGADIDIVTSENWSALHVAIRQGQPDSVAQLIKLECNVNILGGDMADTPLHVAAKFYVEADIMKELLNGKPDLTIRNKEGRLPTEIKTSDELKNLIMEYARN